ncbi:MAG: ankyrin repeat domain-containing protein [Pirellulales bacterium]
MIDASQKPPAGRGRFQFSIRFLFIVTAIVAVLLSIGFTLYPERLADRRPMQFIRAVQSGDLAETDRILEIDPQLAHGRRHRGTVSSMTPLQLALVFGRDPKLVGRILQEKPDLNERSDSGETALHMAVAHQMLSEVARLLRLGADVNVVDDEGMTPLHVAAKVDRDGQMTKLLMEAGSNPNGAEPGILCLRGRTPLHLAAGSGNAAAVTHLLKGGAQVNGRDMGGGTALHLAMSGGCDKVSEILVEHGADLTAKDDTGHIPGQRSDSSYSNTAAMIWWERIVQLHEQGKISKLNDMLDAAPQVLSFRTEYSPETLLHRAVEHQRLDVLDYLLGRHIDPDVRGVEGQTPLHFACYGHVPVDLAKHLLDAGADIEAKDQSGQTPLHWVSRAHHHEMLQMLIARGSNMNALDNAGTTVLDAAFEGTFHHPTGQRTIELLRRAGHPATVLYAAATGDVELLHELTRGDSKLLNRSYARNGVWPLHAAVLGGQPRAVEWLIDQRVDRNPLAPANRVTRPLDTPLMIALSYDKTDIALLLINRGADVNCRGFTGHCPVHAVIEWNRAPKILEALLTHRADPSLKHQNKTAAELAIQSKSEHRGRYIELLHAFGKGKNQ